MSPGGAAGLRFRDVGGVTVYVEYHVTSGEVYLGIRVCGGVVEKPEGVCVCFLSSF